jgi:hypothetical protein
MGCETPRVSDEERGSDLGVRTLGFLVTVLGALLAGIGAVLDWILVTIEGAEDELAPTWRGLDTAGGKVVLIAAVLALVAVLATRVGGTATARRGAAVVVIAAGVAIVAAAALEAVTAEDRYASDAITEARDVVTSLGVPADDLDAVLDELRDMLEVRLEPGLWVAIAGGAITAAGGAVTLAWASRRDADRTTVDDDRAAAGHLGEREPRSSEYHS